MRDGKGMQILSGIHIITGRRLRRRRGKAPLGLVKTAGLMLFLRYSEMLLEFPPRLGLDSGELLFPKGNGSIEGYCLSYHK